MFHHRGTESTEAIGEEGCTDRLFHSNLNALSIPIVGKNVPCFLCSHPLLFSVASVSLWSVSFLGQSLWFASRSTFGSRDSSVCIFTRR